MCIGQECASRLRKRGVALHHRKAGVGEPVACREGCGARSRAHIEHARDRRRAQSLAHFTEDRVSGGVSCGHPRHQVSGGALAGAQAAQRGCAAFAIGTGHRGGSALEGREPGLFRLLLDDASDRYWQLHSSIMTELLRAARVGISRRGKLEPGNDGYENGGNGSGFRERGKFEPGTKIRQKAANFEPGTDLRRTHGSGFSREATA